MSGSGSSMRLAAFNTFPTDCRNRNRMATFCSESSATGLPSPGVHGLVSWERANKCSWAVQAKLWLQSYLERRLAPWAVHIFRVAASVLSCPLLRDWSPSAADARLIPCPEKGLGGSQKEAS